MANKALVQDLDIYKPDLISPKNITVPFKRGIDASYTIKMLEAGQEVLIKGFYNNGLFLLRELKAHLNEKYPNRSFQEQRKYRALYRALSNRILIEVVNHQLAVKKAPDIGWLKKLYPENNHFLLPYPQVQGLNSSWQWHKNGISIPVLRNKIYPYYGVYFPTRFDHLRLFDDWLTHYDGPKKKAIDVGFGSGILSLQLVKHGFQQVFGTDINPNAVIGLTEQMGETKLSRKIMLDCGHLFGKWHKPTELIVFNPPWLPKTHDLDRVDEAIYYKKDLFPDFFTSAKERLLPEGKLVLIFSNLAQITGITQHHPIEHEIHEGGRFQLHQYFQKKVKAASKKTKRNQHWRALEKVELWVLKHK